MGARGGKDSVYSGAKIGGSLAKIKASVALGTRLGLKDQNWVSGANIRESGAKIVGSGVKIEGWGA